MSQIIAKLIKFSSNPGAKIDIDSFPFKSERFMPVFSNLCYIHDIIQQLIAHNADYVDQRQMEMIVS